jgi:hypothetical protein
LAGIRIDVVFGIRNEGRGIALYPAIALYETSSFKLSQYGLDGNRNTGLPERLRTSIRPDEARRIFAGGADDAIHPGTTLDVTSSRLRVLQEQLEVPDLVVRYDLYCEGFSESGEATITFAGFLKRLRGF